MPEELLDEWVTILGLKDWKITLKTNVKPEDMDIEDADGCTSYIEACKAARIQIVDPKKRDKVIPGEKLIILRPFDFETVLVHELLHLKFSLIGENGKWETKLQLRVLHQIIDDIARALIDAKRNMR